MRMWRWRRWSWRGGEAGEKGRIGKKGRIREKARIGEKEEGGGIEFADGRLTWLTNWSIFS